MSAKPQRNQFYLPKNWELIGVNHVQTLCIRCSGMNICPYAALIWRVCCGHCGYTMWLPEKEFRGVVIMPGDEVIH